MKANPYLHAWLACACLAISGAAGASDPEAVRSLQRRWAEVKYAADEAVMGSRNRTETEWNAKKKK
mgnify:CR=1 FL=1